MTHPELTARRVGRRSWASALWGRWPTWFAIALTALTAGDPGSPKGLSEALLLFALGYLSAAVLRRRGATWILAVIAVAALAALRLQDLVEPTVVLLAAALALVIWGSARGQLWPPGAVMVESAGMAIFAAIALGAMAVDRELGLYIVAAGWAGHAAWDFFHLRYDKVVARSFAEWCGIFDLLGAVSILLVSLL